MQKKTNFFILINFTSLPHIGWKLVGIDILKFVDPSYFHLLWSVCKLQTIYALKKKCSLAGVVFVLGSMEVVNDWYRL
jgi:hypothetical protein